MGKTGREKGRKNTALNWGWGWRGRGERGLLQPNENRNVTEKAGLPILNYCLNIPHIPMMRFNTKI